MAIAPRASLVQLARLTLRFCGASGSSSQARVYVEKNKLEELAAKYDAAFVAAAAEAPGKHPHAEAEYANGTTQVVPLRKLSVEQIDAQLDALAQRRGRKMSSVTKINRVVGNVSQGVPDAKALPVGVAQRTQGSVQGVWGGLGKVRPLRASKEGRTPRKSPTLSRKHIVAARDMAAESKP
ncbi:uncharacterized protein AMSG_04688 [Thecamonas trahens ATCC 50062]|uniref:Large ribosomal subunit protein mL43 n=1 Tax=Thecamonas trahens ATCC 50062 TaxID=461836 RepID=A0A0L0DCA7_THETB|nr:hypothetical protein AMSG_04688 [Thecamonas trahens ATCC 50062]KNC48943.1 hypothetical protein AMSG_04688 [Thecamonas trahens ATCC 50062]|eukprot:XP_013758360.1 hypothetical protein AMSG_04688 [Thecamonas trahens ATCC 50062]